MTTQTEMLSDLRERMAGLEVTVRHMAMTLDNVLVEARRTNGRVIRLETDAATAATAAEAAAAEAAKDKSWRDRYVAPVVTGLVLFVATIAARLLGLA